MYVCMYCSSVKIKLITLLFIFCLDCWDDRRVLGREIDLWSVNLFGNNSDSQRYLSQTSYITLARKGEIITTDAVYVKSSIAETSDIFFFTGLKITLIRSFALRRCSGRLSN